MICHACGSPEATLEDAFAAVEQDEDVEVLRARCVRCGSSWEATRRVA